MLRSLIILSVLFACGGGPGSDACNEFVDVLYRHTALCGGVISQDLHARCEGKVISNAREIRETCIPQVESDSCEDLFAKRYCQPEAL